jgi:hypothetical protein
MSHALYLSTEDLWSFFLSMAHTRGNHTQQKFTHAQNHILAIFQKQSKNFQKEQNLALINTIFSIIFCLGKPY